MQQVTQNNMIEWTFQSTANHEDPFNQVELSVHFTDPEGQQRTVPGFWAGGDEWRVRYASPVPGRHRFETVCSDTADTGLHGRTGEVDVAPYDGDNPLFRHGPLAISADKRHLQQVDGTPFFWLGDTWWMGLCQRLSWPGDYQTLTADRVDKGFTVIQIVAGLYPDMPAFDPRGANEAGFPWEPEYARINPAYFDRADQRLAWLVEAGLAPCIVGAWGYHLPWLGVDKMKQHWRYLMARWGAYPVVWCLAGEATMPYYLANSKSQDPSSKDREQDAGWLKQGWTEVARYVGEINAFGHPVTIHPTQYGRDQIEDAGLMDFEMLQTGHSSHLSFPTTIDMLEKSRERAPKMPVLVAEACYEGILEANREEIQRMLFWGCMLSGAAGHTYGANGIWQVNSRKALHGPSPYGTSWGDTLWEEAYQLPGAANLGIGQKLLAEYPWWRMEPHPEWVPPRDQDVGDRWVAYAAGIPRELRIIYFGPFLPLDHVARLEAEVRYRATLVNPSTGERNDLGLVLPDERGAWRPPALPVNRDWVMVLEAE